METQFNRQRGKELGEIGLSLAVETAEKEFPGWKERCWTLFTKWISKKPVGFEFQTELFRQDCEKWKMIEKPNSLRAYGFIPKRAEKAGLIRFAGNRKVSNVKAHACFSSVWVKV